MKADKELIRMNHYQCDYRITPLASDMFGLCRPSSLLGFIQDASLRHEDQIGFDRHKMREERGAVWLMARAWYSLSSPLRLDDNISIATQPRPVDGMFLYRDFDIYLGNEQVGEAVNVWIIVDAESYRPLRPSFIKLEASGEVKTIKPGKIKFPGIPQPSGSRLIRYSDTDYYGHMTNTRYADVVCDAAELNRLNKLYVRTMQINYLKEALPGEELLLSAFNSGDTTYIRANDAANTVKFEAFIEKERIS